MWPACIVCRYDMTHMFMRAIELGCNAEVELPQVIQVHSSYTEDCTHVQWYENVYDNPIGYLSSA